MKSQKSKRERLAIVFDWDGVIFNSDTLKKVARKSLKELGYSESVFERTIRAAVDSRGGYSLERHGKLLAKELPHSPAGITKLMHRAIMKHPGDFLFPDAQRALKGLHKRGFFLDILTAGNREMQDFKIVRSGLKPLFRAVHTVSPSEGLGMRKISVLKKIAQTHGKVIFFDDRVETILAVTAVDSLKEKVSPVLVWRQKARPPRGLCAVRKLDAKQVEQFSRDLLAG